MKERKFKIGDRVRIHPSSRFAHQCSQPGVVRKVEDGRWIGVDFDNSYSNAYPPEDLYFDESHVDQEFHVGDMVQITQGSENWAPEMDKYVGKIATIKKVKTDSYGNHIYKLDADHQTWNWWPSKGHFIHAPQHGMDQKDELLYRAEQMFPVGTRFYPAHLSFDKEDSEYCVMTDDSVIEFGPDGNICATIHDGENWDHLGESKYGNTRLNRVLYYKPERRWATIVKEAPQFKVGDKVMITQSEDNWCTEMDEFVGIIATLVKTKGSNGTHYAIDLDKGEWAWSDKDGHFRKPTKEELASSEPEPIKYKYKIGEKVMLTKTCHAVSPQEVTIRDYSKSTSEPAYVLHTWAGHFPEDILSPIEEHELEPKEDFLAMAELKYPVGTKYKCAAGGEYVYTVEKQSFSLHDPVTVYAETHKGCLYKDGKWAQIVESVKPDFKFKVGDWVVGNSKANARYMVTREGWTGEVTKVEERNGSLFISVQGKYNKDNSEYHSLDAIYFDLTTEDACTPKIDWRLATSDSYIKQQLDKVRITSADIEDIRQEAFYGHKLTPVVEELPTFRVKKVSFNRI